MFLCLGRSYSPRAPGLPPHAPAPTSPGRPPRAPSRLPKTSRSRAEGRPRPPPPSGRHEVVKRADVGLGRWQPHFSQDRHQLLAEALKGLGRLPDVEDAQRPGLLLPCGMLEASAARPVRKLGQRLAVVESAAYLVVLIDGRVLEVEVDANRHCSPPLKVSDSSQR